MTIRSLSPLPLLVACLFVAADAAGDFHTGVFTDTYSTEGAAVLEPSGGGDDVSLAFTFGGPARQVLGTDRITTEDLTGDGIPDSIDNRYAYQTLQVQLGELTGTLAASAAIFDVFLFENVIGPGEVRRGLYLPFSMPVTGTDPALPDVTSIFVVVQIDGPGSTFDFLLLTEPDPGVTDGLLNGMREIEKVFLPVIMKTLGAAAVTDPDVNSFVTVQTNRGHFLFGSLEDFSVTVIPLPAAWMLIVPALGAMGLRRARRREASAHRG